MTLSPSTQSTVLRDHPELSAKPASSFRHPSYTFVKRTPQEILDRRLQLGIPADAHVIGALGRIGHYKGLPELIEAFRAIEDDRLRLVICGKPKNASTRTDVETATANEPRIRLCFDFLTDEDFALTTSLLGDFAAATPQLPKPELSALDPILAAREILRFVRGISV
jgi:glycosyltransferase involved in cell wall biosynthesis